MPSEHHPLNMSDTQSWLPQVRNDENLTWWMALFWDFFSGQPSTYTAVQQVLISNGWTAHLTACSWVNKSRFMTGGWRVRSVTLSSSNPIHGSTLPARISINDTKEEIWKGIIPSYFPSFLADAALSWIIKHREGLHFTVFTPSSSYSQFYVRLSANNRLAAKQ